jgi:signal transduction histidine kinase
LQRIVSSVNMLTDILNDFLSLGKIEEGKISVKPSRFNIHEYISKVTGDLRSALKPAQKIYYQHEGATDVTLDPLLFRHIILNLLSNASKFSPENSPIEMKTSCCGNRLILSVKDLGIGIPEQDREHLMERFYRGINAGNIQGTGLGLHIIAKYAELMNGTVEYKSELDKGTEFIITFIVKPDSHEKDFAD